VSTGLHTHVAWLLPWPHRAAAVSATPRASVAAEVSAPPVARISTPACAPPHNLDGSDSPVAPSGSTGLLLFPTPGDLYAPVHAGQTLCVQLKLASLSKPYDTCAVCARASPPQVDDIDSMMLPLSTMRHTAELQRTEFELIEPRQVITRAGGRERPPCIDVCGTRICERRGKRVRVRNNNDARVCKTPCCASSLTLTAG
jgi:hypothetical protein